MRVLRRYVPRKCRNSPTKGDRVLLQPKNLKLAHELIGPFSAFHFPLSAFSLWMIVNVRGRPRHFRTVTFDAAQNAVLLIEQRLLPHTFEIVAIPDFRKTARAITDMIVRGAGAIGATAAYGLAQ